MASVNNFLVTKDGVRYCTQGIQHNIWVRTRLKTTLKEFLQGGGIRVKTHNDHMAVEAGRPLTVGQKTWVREALKEHDYFSLVVSIGGKYAAKERFRAIRSL
ncbi:hypothetical protein LCGC14_2592540 [marine sediment metagenome]|uniref:Uncharacterized protein n=1 Tax=marine sediment metagenome TaxID=412755 RepID=A0A0F9ABI1_9ZZZZ